MSTNLDNKSPGFRILLSELGNNASGDEALYVAATRRLLQRGHLVNWLVRLTFSPTIQRAGLMVQETLLPVDPRFFRGVRDRKSLVSTYRSHAPADWIRLKKQLDAHDILMIAPGGKFVDGYSIARVLLAASAAQEMKMPVIILNQTFGPMCQEADISLLREVLDDCALVVIRDELSLGFLETIRTNNSNLVMARDLIFAESYPAPRPDQLYDLGLNFRFGFNGHTSLPVFSKFLGDYRRQWPGHRINIYTTTHPLTDDIAGIAAEFGCDIDKSMPVYPEYLQHPGKCRLNITDSFHGAIFSLLAEKPVIICQPDFTAYKFEGSTVPGQETWKPLTGLTTDHDIPLMMNAIAEQRNRPDRHAAYQSELLAYGHRLVQTGWDAVDSCLEKLPKKQIASVP